MKILVSDSQVISGETYNISIVVFLKFGLKLCVDPCFGQNFMLC